MCAAVTPKSVIAYVGARDAGCGFLIMGGGGGAPGAPRAARAKDRDVRHCGEAGRLGRLDECRAAARGIEDLLGRLVADQNGLVVTCVRRFNAAADVNMFDEWCASGQLGLVGAATRYDPGQGAWSGFSTRYIKAEVLAAVRADEGMQLTDTDVRIRKHYRDALKAEIEDEADQLAYIRKAMNYNVSEETFARVCADQHTTHTCTCGQVPCVCGGANIDKAAADTADAAVSAVFGRQLRSLLRDAMKDLSPRQLEFLVLAYGLGGEPPMKNADIARAWGVSSSRVTTIKRETMAKLHASQGALRHMYDESLADD